MVANTQNLLLFNYFTKFYIYLYFWDYLQLFNLYGANSI